MNKTIALGIALAAATSYKPEAVSLGVKAHKLYALYRAAREEDVIFLKAFISAGYAVEEKEDRKLWSAYAKEALEMIEKKVDINAKDNNGYTPLHTAAKEGQTAKVWALIAKGANIEAKADGYTPLHWAAQNGHEAVAKLLIDNKANLEAKDKWEYTPLHRAARYGHKDVATLLIAKGAKVNARNNDRKTPLGEAKKSWRNTEAVQALLRKHGGR